MKVVFIWEYMDAVDIVIQKKNVRIIIIMKTKICTSLEQSKKLIELGIDVNTADMCWQNNEFPIGFNDNDAVPAWSLTALLGLMPDKISINNESYYPSFDKKTIAFRGPITWDGQKSKSFEMDNILDAAFEMVCWLKENNEI